MTRWQFLPARKWRTVGSLLPRLTSVLGGPVSQWVFSVALPLPWGCAFSLPPAARSRPYVLGAQRLPPSDFRTVLLGEGGLGRLVPGHHGSRSLCPCVHCEAGSRPPPASGCSLSVPGRNTEPLVSAVPGSCVLTLAHSGLSKATVVLLLVLTCLGPSSSLSAYCCPSSLGVRLGCLPEPAR